MATRSKYAARTAGRKCRVLWISLTAFFLISACMFTSLGQILLETDKRTTPETRGYSLLPDNPVFSPLASLRFRDYQYSPGAHVIYDSSDLPGRAFPGQEGAQWWLPESEELTDEADPFDTIDVRSLSGKFENRGPFSMAGPRDLDLQITAGDLVNIGVADILSFLREKELRRERSGSSTNPFDEALNEAPDETAQGKDDRVAESDPPKKDNKGGDDRSSGGGSSASRNFLFIGRFNDQPVQTVIGNSDRCMSADGSAVFELAGIGEASFDLDIVLRGRESQESVSFGSLNGDGFMDVVVTNKTTNQAYVYTNDGNGGYFSKGGIYGGHGPSMTVIGDFSGDGSPDISVMLQADRRIVVEGKGLGKFLFLPTSDVDDAYSSMIPYDFNGDGLNDLLLTNHLSSIATVYRNQGQALFAAAESFPLQTFPYLQSSVDLNGDWVNDLIHIQYLGGYVSLAFQNGSDGTISSIANTILDPSLYYVLGDFDNDGMVDIALAYRK